MTAYKGKVTWLKNPQKYLGDINNITYRSIWERNVMRWLDENPKVKEWGSEEIAIPYNHPIKGTKSKYYPDFFIHWEDESMAIVEVKPEVQTVPPTQPSRKTQRYLTEVATYAINQEKWKEAKALCQRNSLRFEVWTERTLHSLGIPTTATKAQKEQKERQVRKPVFVPTVRPTRPRPKRRS